MSVTFNPEYDAANIPVAQGWLHKIKAQHPAVSREDGSACWVIVGGQKVFQEYICRPCHAYFGESFGGKPKDIDLIANYVQADTEQENLYLRWLGEESPISRYCLNAKTAVEDGGIIMPCDLPSTFLHMGNLLARFLNEHRYWSSDFAKYYNMGFEGIFAYLAACIINTSNDPSNGIYYRGGYHGVAWSSFTKGLIDNLLSENFTNIDKYNLSYKHGARRYYGSSSIGHSGDNTGILEWFKGRDPDFMEKLNAFRGVKEIVSPISNPFAVKPVTNQNSIMTGAEFEEVFLPHLKEKGLYIRHGYSQ